MNTCIRTIYITSTSTYLPILPANRTRIRTVMSGWSIPTPTIRTFTIGIHIDHVSTPSGTDVSVMAAWIASSPSRFLSNRQSSVPLRLCG